MDQAALSGPGCHGRATRRLYAGAGAADGRCRLAGDQASTATYRYDGYKILTYKSGKKGVRYLFTAEGDSQGAPKHIQFSDHEIGPTKAEHFHIFAGDQDHEKLLEEMENWPTYYPSDLDVYEIIDEMIAHQLLVLRTPL